jgi:hypothetical protein
MAITSLNEIESLIKQQIQIQEEVQEYLLKAEAIANVALCEGFLDYKKSIIHAYLWALGDFISKIKNRHELGLSTLSKYDSRNWVFSQGFKENGVVG